MRHDLRDVDDLIRLFTDRPTRRWALGGALVGVVVVALVVG